jgi:metal-responsive CopG/Arc/MetJ family transcriptional regulator
MAKVLISMPTDLLTRLDHYVRARGLTRSGLLRELAERELRRDDQARAARIDELLGKPGRYGGCGAAEVRRLRATG